MLRNIQSKRRNLGKKQNPEKDYSIKVLQPDKFDKQLVKEIKKRVVRESGRHMKDKITLEEFRAIYHKFGKQMDERNFAIEILRD